MACTPPLDLGGGWRSKILGVSGGLGNFRFSEGGILSRGGQTSRGGLDTFETLIYNVNENVGF